MIEPRNDPFDNPFWESVDTLRKDAILDMIRDHSPIRGKVLDLGGDSPFAADLRAEGLDIAHLPAEHDLDYDVLTGMWRTILSFEVIEHLGNPLHHLTEIRKHLRPTGEVFLSTPVAISKWRPDGLLRRKHHVFEMDMTQLRFLIDKAGLRIADERYTRYRRLGWHFTGLRPILRLLTERCVILRLIHKDRKES